MKAAVIGYGNVGMAVFNALLNMPQIHELVLCGRNKGRIDGELTDFRDSLAINSGIRTKIGGGGYEMTEGADVIVYTAGPAVKDASQDRMDIARESVGVVREVSEELNRYNRDAVLVVISNPVDILVSAFVRFTGRPRRKVIGTGTLLDTARLKRFLADLLDIQPRDVTAYVLGEHGNSSCIIWDWTRIMSQPVDEFLSSQIGEKVNLSLAGLEQMTRRVGYYIFERKGSTSYGVAAAAAQIVSAVLSDSHEIMPVSVALEGEYGIGDVALSVPCFIGAGGASVVPGPRLSDEDDAALKASAEVIRHNSEGLLQID